MAGIVRRLTSAAKDRMLAKAENNLLRSTLDIDPLLDEEVKALKKKAKEDTLTAREEKRLDMLLNRRIQEGGAERAEGMSRVMKERGLSEKEKREMQESLNYKKGGMVKKPAKKTVKMAGGGYANCGASMKPAQKAKKK
jgi:hypothetical protein